MVAISPNSQLPGFLIAGILVAIKSVIASTIGYAWFLAGELDTKVSVVCFESVDLVFLIQIPKDRIRAEIQRAIRNALFVQFMCWNNTGAVGLDTTG